MPNFSIESIDFSDGEEIPKKFGYHFENIPPRIIFKNIPKNTQSLALIMDDPDAMAAVGKIWVHWLVCDIPINQEFFKEMMGTLGKTDFNEIGYGGPAPPDKQHTYIFRVYALNLSKLNLSTGYSKIDLENAMKNHILDEATIKGTFSP